jgi:hypothetical protein
MTATAHNTACARCGEHWGDLYADGCSFCQGSPMPPMYSGGRPLCMTCGDTGRWRMYVGPVVDGPQVDASEAWNNHICRCRAGRALPDCPECADDGGRYLLVDPPQALWVTCQACTKTPKHAKTASTEVRAA